MKVKTEDIPELLSVEDAAKILGVAIQTMYEIANNIEFPAAVFVTRSRGRKMYRIHKGKLLKWIDGGGFGD